MSGDAGKLVYDNTCNNFVRRLLVFEADVLTSACYSGDRKCLQSCLGTF